MVLDCGEGFSHLKLTGEFLANLAPERGRVVLALLNLAPWEFPEASEVLSGSPLAKQDLVIPDDDGADNLKHGARIPRDRNGGHHCWKDGRCPRAWQP